jgi:hypothetical protein
MSENNGTPFRPFAKESFGTLAKALAIRVAMLVVIMTAALIVTVATVYLMLVVVGNFDLSLANCLGLGGVWYIADVSLRKGFRDAFPQD